MTPHFPPSKGRRDFLRFAASSFSAAAAATILPASIRKALALPANTRTGTIEDIEHIVILMQENRSFDHYFGTLRGVRGYGDPRAIRLPGGDPVFRQPNGTGFVMPFRPHAGDLGLQYMQGTPHNWPDSHGAWNAGRMDAWIPNKGTTTMAYFTREDIPFHYALADAFTICDAYHCSLLGATDPNRYHMWIGWVGNDGSGGGPVVDNSELGYGWSTYPERLEAAGISWKIYQDIGTGLDAAGFWGWTEDAFIGNYGDNSLLYFDQYRNALPGDALYEKARTGTNAANGDGYFDQLAADVANNTLPQVSYIVAPEAFSEHSNWPANYGAWYVAQVLDILTSNPELWSKTALFVTYDENDGFFDHVPPPYAPWDASVGLSTVDTTNEHFAGGGNYAPGPYGLGHRVPMIVVSPWTRGGWVCSEVFDHTSLIRFIERRFGAGNPALTETNITPWRRAVCGDLVSAFDFVTPNEAPPTLPSTEGYTPPDQNRHDDFVPVPPVHQGLPMQEIGTRPARALPYDFSIAGRIDAAEGRYWLDFANAGAAAAAFQIYSGNRSDGPWAYTVGAGAELSDAWSALAVTNGLYDLSAFGPNGFLRTFAGDMNLALDGTSANPDVAADYDSSSDALVVHVTNEGASPCTVTATANHYSSAPPQKYVVEAGATIDIAWPLAASAHWYDLTLTSDHDKRWTRRLAGHIETGAPSTSDPAYGQGGADQERVFGDGFD